MRKKSFLLLLPLFLILNAAGQSNSQIQKFWNIAQARLDNQLMSDQSRALIYATIKTNSITEKLAKAEILRSDKVLQDRLMLRFLIVFGNSELLRMEMADMCGTYTLGNQVANYIVAKYSKDKRYLSIKEERQKKRVADAKKQKHSDELIQKESQKEQENAALEREEERKQKLSYFIQANTKDTIFKEVEVKAYSLVNWGKFINTNIHIDSLRNKNISGTYFVHYQFIVDEQGNCSDIKVYGNNINDEVLAEVKKTLATLPKYEPAKINGRNVKSLAKGTITLDISE
jgi:hypothetical protein